MTSRRFREPPLPEEREPCGSTGLAFHYCAYSFKRSTPPIGDVLVAQPHTSRLLIWEPLLTKAPAPPKAGPYCCYTHTVIFYHHPYIIRLANRYWRDLSGVLRVSQPRGFEQWDQTETRLTQHDVVAWGGGLFDMGLGRVLWRRRRWWMLHCARRRQLSRERVY